MDHKKYPNGSSKWSKNGPQMAMAQLCLPLKWSKSQAVSPVGHGSKPRTFVNIPIPTKMGSKMGGEFTEHPKMVLNHGQLNPKAEVRHIPSPGTFLAALGLPAARPPGPLPRCGPHPFLLVPVESLACSKPIATKMVVILQSGLRRRRSAAIYGKGIVPYQPSSTRIGFEQVAQLVWSPVAWILGSHKEWNFSDHPSNPNYPSKLNPLEWTLLVPGSELRVVISP